MIISIFVIWEVASVLAHVTTHRVAGITLPPADANTTFSSCFRLDCWNLRKNDFELG